MGSLKRSRWCRRDRQVPTSKVVPGDRQICLPMDFAFSTECWADPPKLWEYMGQIIHLPPQTVFRGHRVRRQAHRSASLTEEAAGDSPAATAADRPLNAMHRKVYSGRGLPGHQHSSEWRLRAVVQLSTHARPETRPCQPSSQTQRKSVLEGLAGKPAHFRVLLGCELRIENDGARRFLTCQRRSPRQHVSALGESGQHCWIVDASNYRSSSPPSLRTASPISSLWSRNSSNVCAPVITLSAELYSLESGRGNVSASDRSSGSIGRIT